MKNLIVAISLGAIIFISFNNLKAGVFNAGYGGDPHDSLLYDDGGVTAVEIPINLGGFDDCSIRVTKVKGKVIGKVFQAFYEARGCEGGFDTVYREVERQVKVGDILVGGGNIETGDDGYLEMGYFTSVDLLKKNYPAMTNKINKTRKLKCLILLICVWK